MFAENIPPAFEGTVTCEWSEQPYDTSLANSINFKFNRSSDSTVMVTGKDVSFRVVNGTSGKLAVVMLIKAVDARDVQNYSCTIQNGTNLVVSKILPLRARPVPKFEVTSVTVVEGLPFQLNCSFASASAFNVSGYLFKNNDEVVSDLLVSPVSGIRTDLEKQKVMIAAVRKEHRGWYSCVAMNEVGSTKLEVRLRVKSPFAALWPAIGIFLEVLALVIIVFVYERKRANKKKEDAALGEDEQDAHGNSNDKTKNADVRQRGAKA